MKQTKKSLMEWGKKTDISKELYRVYVHISKEGYVYEDRIMNPSYLIVSDNGHRIVDKNFISHYIPYGFIRIYWENVDKKKYQFNHQRPGATSDAVKEQRG